MIRRKNPKAIQRSRREATKYLISDRILDCRHRTNDSPAMILVSGEERKIAMEATHELNSHHGRKETLWKIAEWYSWSEMYADVKAWVKTCEQY